MKNKPIPFRAASPWFEIRNQTAAAADIFIYDYIDIFGVNVADVVKQLQALAVATINLHINSPGGSVFDGFTLYNVLTQHAAKIVVHIDGIAASIASVIAMAGDEIRMAENAMIMIHEPSCGAFGDSAELRKQADVLDKLRDSIVATYAARTGQKPEDIAKMMTDETWLNASEAKAKGFATAIVAAKQMAASFDLSAYRNAPSPTISAPTPETRQTPIGLTLRRQALLEKLNR